jgi:hypothetical protein
MREVVIIATAGVLIGNRLRHFPPPWTVEEADACFVVKDSNGQALVRQLHEAPNCDQGRNDKANPRYIH